MYNFYAESIYNLYLKEERKKRNLKLEDLSKSLSFSLGFVSQLENSINILNNDKISVLLTFYGYDKDYLSRFNQTVNKLMSKFCHHLLYMENQMVKESYNEMEEFFSNYKNTSLEQIFLSCKFIYNVYFNDANTAKEYLPPVTHFQYYGEYFLAILNIYIARYHMLCMNYEKSIETLTVQYLIIL